MLSNNKQEKMILDKRKLKLKQQEMRFSKDLKMRKKGGELIRNTLKISEMSFIFKNLRSKLVKENALRLRSVSA